jgi:hypothetical protein
MTKRADFLSSSIPFLLFTYVLILIPNIVLYRKSRPKEKGRGNLTAFLIAAVLLFSVYFIGLTLYGLKYFKFI